MPTIPFIGGAYESRSPNMNAQRCVNLYAEMDPQQGKNVAALIGTPGLKPFADTGTGKQVQGLHSWDSDLFAVSDATLYKFDANGNRTTIASLGTSASSTARISMEHNPFQLIMVDGARGWIYTKATATVAKITTAGFSGGSPITFQDGYFILANPGTRGQWQISGLNNGFAWDPTQYATAEGAPDPLVSMIADHRETWAFGTESTEVYYNSGAQFFPFDRIQGGFIEVGCAAPYSVAKCDNTIFWLAQDRRGFGQVCRANGYVPQVISTRALEHAINSSSVVSDAFAYAYQQEGHIFYVLTFPTANKTWVYDASTQLWHERAYFDQPTATLNRHRSNCYGFFMGRHIVGDYANGKLYQLDLDTYTDDTSLIKRIRSCPHVHKDRLRILVHKFEVDMEFGTGLNSGQGADPQMMLRYSDDGGHTWSNELLSSVGKIGEYFARAVWRRLGFTRDRVFEVSVTDPVKVVLINAHVDATPCRN